MDIKLTVIYCFVEEFMKAHASSVRLATVE